MHHAHARPAACANRGFDIAEQPCTQSLQTECIYDDFAVADAEICIGLGVPAFLNFAFAREQYAFGADEQFINRHAKRLPEDYP